MPKNPFFDFRNISEGDLQRLKSALQRRPGNNTYGRDIASLMDEFLSYVASVLRQIHVRFRERHPGDGLPETHLDYNPETDQERFMRDTWGVQADHWALIEVVEAYFTTMLTILEKMHIPDDNHFMLTSLGSGPGLYETFLARFFNRSGVGGILTCVDFAKEMTATQQYVISLEQPPLLNVKPVTADMTRIPLPDHSQDAVLCNNSLQWCLQWPKAIEEMARILDPSRKPWAYLVVHTHERPMHIGTDTGECPIKMPRVLVPGILDELERHGFSIMTTRQIHGGAKTGQGQAGFERLFIKAEFTPGGLRHSWRNATTSLDTVRAMRLKK